MTYVAIVKTAKESLAAIHKGLPAEFPIECEEFQDSASALAKWPDKKIMTAEHYATYADAMNEIFKHVREQKPWWKFW